MNQGAAAPHNNGGNVNMTWRYEKLSFINGEGKEEGIESIAPHRLIELLESKRGSVPNDYIVSSLSINGWHLVVSFEPGDQEEAYLDRLPTKFFLRGDIDLSKCLHMGRSRYNNTEAM